jgi:hypothetical protein
MVMMVVWKQAVTSQVIIDSVYRRRFKGNIEINQINELMA